MAGSFSFTLNYNDAPFIAFSANLGGTLGCCLGASLLTLVEVVDFIMVESFKVCSQLIKKRKIKPSTNKN
mgnify:CR=1 FL=1